MASPRWADWTDTEERALARHCCARAWRLAASHQKKIKLGGRAALRPRRQAMNNYQAALAVEILGELARLAWQAHPLTTLVSHLEPSVDSIR